MYEMKEAFNKLAVIKLFKKTTKKMLYNIKLTFIFCLNMDSLRLTLIRKISQVTLAVFRDSKKFVLS